jgi:formamidopyrimidine-DNA glycosylase
VPELPELEVVREVLGPRMEGRVLTDVVVSPRLGFLLRTPVGDLATTLRGRTLQRMRRRGKFMQLEVGADAGSAPELVLVDNPMLGGRFQWADPAEKVSAATVVRLGFDDGSELRLTDTARMGRIYLVAADRLEDVPGYAEQGPEALGVDLEEWRRRIRRHPGELKNLLRNQSFVTGIGNAYSDEILWDAKLLPLRRRSTLKDDEVEQLWRSTQSVLTSAIESIRGQAHYEPHKQDRSFMRVHMKGGQDCPRCGHRISELTARGEVTNFCRGCQK